MKVVLENVTVNKNRIDYSYSKDKELDIFFDDNYPFYIEYLTDISFEEVPKSILAVPFVTNLLPLCWLFDITIEVDELDETFYYSIDEIKKGFNQIYKTVPLKGGVKANKLVKNSYPVSDRVTCLFSGGVDASLTFLQHREEKPVLFNVWGVDIDFDDALGHEETEQYFNKIADQFSVEYICIKSTLRKFLNERYLNQEGYKLLEDYWWHGAQHSTGLLSVLAPYDYVHKVKTNYIASSFTQEDFDSGVKSCTYPCVDDALKIADTVMCHDGFEYTRVEKLKRISEICHKEDLSLDLKVCFWPINGKNCNTCEKCYRTMIAMLMFDQDLERYGLCLKSKDTKEIRDYLDWHRVSAYNWIPIQDAYNSDYPENKELKWLKRYRFNKITSFWGILLRIKSRLFRKKGRKEA